MPKSQTAPRIVRCRFHTSGDVRTLWPLIRAHLNDVMDRGQPGVIMTRTKALCLGYLGEQQRWDEKVDGPWFNTGDIGIGTRMGSVVFLDREVDAIPGMSCVEPIVLTWDQVPRTGTGKVQRFALREQLSNVGVTYGTGRWT